MATKIKVSDSKLKQMAVLYSGQSLAENKSKAKGSVFHLNKEYIIVGYISSGKKGIHSVDAYSIVDFMHYKGDLKPLTSDQHYLAVQAGTRERGYAGQIAYIEKRKVVMCDHVDFIPAGTEETKQLELF